MQPIHPFNAIRLSISVLMILAGSLFTADAHAHQSSDSYLDLRLDEASQTLRGRWRVAFRDLDNAITLDLDGDGQIRWGEIEPRLSEISDYAAAHLMLRSNRQDCRVDAKANSVDRRGGLAFAVINLELECVLPIDSLDLEYTLFGDLDPQHRGLLSLKNETQVFSTVLSAQVGPTSIWTKDSKPTGLGSFVRFVQEGVWHIWIGIDHILFLLCLLLPAMIASQPTLKWARPPESVSFEPLGRARTLSRIAKLVTAFTIAHSVTLVLATLQIVSLPSRWIESVIALSIIVVAANNLFRLFAAEGWRFAFAFGLVHGFGFASVLADLALPKGALLAALLGFNLGVELGQLAIVAAFIPLAVFACRFRWYARVLVPVGSTAMGLIAAVWFVERLFDLQVVF